MPVIDIHRPHVHGIAAAKAAVERVAEAIATEYGLTRRWHGDELHFDRHGVKGRIAVAEHDVRVHIELGFLLGALKPVIEREIERQLDRHVA
ncbi:MAG: polyhydroxyalkanoic acid synthase [Rhodanobacteraceae bacterium]|jgi:putative polyhydroxyalkanoate system protein|nr:polyhydroxyalkanoic acid synthase [Rhodanobacteraceae bacterium]